MDKSKRIAGILALSACLGAFTGAREVRAASISWNLSNSGAWNTAANWSPAQVPGPGDDVTIDRPAAVVTAAGTAISFRTLTLGHAGGSNVLGLVLSTTIASGGSITVYTNSVITQNMTQQLFITGDLVMNGGKLTHSSNGSSQAYILNWFVGGDFYLGSSASVDVSTCGYAGGGGSANGYGPGGGTIGSYACGGTTPSTCYDTQGGGAGHGGLGGNTPNGGYGAQYDYAYAPWQLGSGGAGEGYGAGSGSDGGGYVKIGVGGTLTLNGWIIARSALGGTDGTYGSAGGGSGGAILISAARLVDGGGGLNADGGSARNIGAVGGGGGGGLIYVAYGAGSCPASMSAAGGTGSVNGGAGAIHCAGGLSAPPPGTYLNTVRPTVEWFGATPQARMQYAQDAAFSYVTVDSTTLNTFYVTQSDLSHSPYWWRVQNGAQWISSSSFTADTDAPSLDVPQVSTNGASAWTDLPMSSYLRSSTVDARLTVQDTLSGLLVSTVQPSSLVGQWHMNESSGSVALDSSGNGLHATYYNGPVNWVPGTHGSAPTFNGSSQYVYLPYRAELNLLDNFTVEGWAKVPAGATAAGPILGNYNYGATSPSGGYILMVNSPAAGDFAFWTSDVWKSCPGNPGINDGNWHHYAVSQLNGSAAMFLDGRFLCSQPSASAGSSNYAFYIGVYYAGPYFKGPIDEVRVYNVARTPAQVLSDYESDTLNAQYLGDPYHVMYSTTAGFTWNYLSTASVNIAASSGNGDTSARVLTADDIPLVTSTAPYSTTNRIKFAVSDVAGNVSETVYAVLVDTSVPSLIGPASGAFVSTAAPDLAWFNPWGPGTARMQLSRDASFTSVVADSVTANDFYVSTNALVHGQSYWWRVENGLDSGFWSAPNTFVVDAVPPAFSAPQVSTAGAASWTALPMAVYLSSSVANVRITVQDPLAGLQASTGPPAGLIGQWHLDESSGTQALDASTNSYTGYLAAGAAWIPGRRGGALNFASGYVNVPYRPALNLLNNYTLEAWVRTSGAGTMTVASNYNGAGGGYIFGMAAGAPRFYTSGECSPTGVPAFNDGQWHHYAIALTGGTAYYYVDGAMRAKRACSNTAGSGAAFRIGFRPDAVEYFAGAIDEVRAYNVALSSSQILADYEADTLGGHSDGEAYNVIYSTTAGLTWNFVSTASVSIAGVTGNGDTAARVLQADGLQLVTSTGPFAPTNRVGFTVTDQAGNVSTVTYTVLVDTSIPTLNDPADGAFLSTATPLLTWVNPWGPGTARVQVSLNPSFTSVVADSTTANDFYISSNALVNGVTYWWRVENGLNSGFWSSTRSFVMDVAQPVFGAPTVSTDSVNWNALLPGANLPATGVSLRIPVQDPLAGLQASLDSTDLAAQWHMDESSGTSILDASGNGFSGNFVVNPFWTAGVKGGALNFNGVNQYVSAGYQAGLNLLDNFTVEAWVQIPAGYATGGTVVANYNVGSGGYILETNYNGAGNFGFWTNTVWKSCPNNPGINDGRWHHIAATQLSGVTSLYSDGRLLCSVAGSAALSSANRMLIGVYEGAGVYFKGSIDEVRIYAAARTPAQLAADYESDTQGAHYNGAAYNVMYSTTAGLTWRFVPSDKVTLNGTTGNGDTAQRVLEADDIQLVVSSAPYAPTNLVSFTVTDRAGNVSTATYVVPVGVTSLVAPAAGAYVSTAAPTLVWIATGTDRLQLSQNSSFTSVVADSTTANAFYISTNSLASGSAYWWRVGVGASGQWAVSSLTVDTVPPAFGAPTVSTDAVTWNALVPGSNLTGSLVSLRIPVQDPLAGLMTATGPPAGLVAQWHLDESSGAVVLDAAPNGHIPYFVNGPIAWVPGIRGGALYFNGVNQYLNPGYQAELNLLDNFTVEAWAQVPAGDTAGRTILGNYNGASGGYILHANYGTAGNFGFWTNTVWKSCPGNPGINDGRWHHYAATQLSGFTSLYLDGRLLCTQAGSSALGSGNPLYIGIYPGAATFFKGPIDEVRLFNLARTPAQIAADYQSDTLAAHYNGEAYNVRYSTTAGLTWNYVPVENVSIAGSTGNGDTAQRVLEADNIQLVVSTGPGAPTNQVSFTVSDVAGNVSTVTYVVPVGVTSLVAPAWGAYVSTATPTLVWIATGTDRMQLSQNSSFTSVVADSTTANAFYISTNALSGGSAYWWRVGAGTSGQWAVSNFTVDTMPPALTSPQVSTAGATAWTGLPMGTYLSSAAVNARFTVRDLLSGLMESTGPPAGLAAQWHMDESSGTSILDASGNGFTGNFVVNPFWTSGIKGGALNFNGSNQYVSAGYQDGLNLLDNFTVEAWVQIPAGYAAGGTVVANYNTGSGGYILETNYNGAGNFGFWTNTVWKSCPNNPGINDGRWHHIAATQLSGITSLYSDGRLLCSVPGSSALSSANRMLIGVYEGAGVYFKGSIDEVRIYAAARTPAQLAADYESDMLGAHYAGAAYNVQYSTTAGLYWNYLPPGSVSISGGTGNGDTAARVLQASDIPLVTSTGPFAPTNLVSVTVTDQAGNVSTATYTVLVDTSVPTRIGPPDAVFVSTATPGLSWFNPWGAGTARVQLSQNSGFTSVIADSVTANDFYFSTNVLTNGSSYWWRVQNGLNSGFWTPASGFTVDTDTPAFSAPQVSTAGAASWNALPATVYLSSTVVNARITVRDVLSGLLVSTGVPPGLEGQWHLDESSGAVALDASGGGPGGNLGAAVTRVPGIRGNAVSCNGSAASVVSFPAAPTAAVDNWTISAWIKPANLAQLGMAVYNGVYGANGYGFGVGNGAGAAGAQLQGVFHGLIWVPSGYTFPSANQWYHVAMARGGGVTRFYVNGVQTPLTSATAPLAPTDFGICSSNGGGYYNGAVDEVRVYSVARSSAQIMSDYESDTLAGHYNGEAYNVIYSTTAGVTWNYVPVSRVNIAGASGNGDTASRVLTADAIPLVTSTGPFAPTNMIGFTVADQAGNVSTAAYAVLVDTSIPVPNDPPDGAYLSTTTPVLTWTNPWGPGTARVQIALDQAFTSVVADSTTANDFYFSTGALASGTVYWWRVENGLNSGFWASTRSFTVDAVQPAFGAPTVSNDGVSWTALLPGTRMGGTQVSLRIPLQDPLAGLQATLGGTGLAYQWHLDESSGTAALDAAGSGLTGNLINTPSWVPGLKGGALYFNGTNEYIQTAGNIPITGNVPRTLSFWFYPTAAGNRDLMTWGAGAGSQMYGLLFNTARQLYFWGYSNDFTCATPVSLNTWHHVALTFDGATVRVYLDGVLDGWKATTLNTAATPLYVGYNRVWGYFQGQMDEVRIYNTARTPAQVAAEFESDTLGAHYGGEAYNVRYSTNAGLTWYFAPADSVTLNGTTGNGDTAQRVLEVDGLDLAVSTGPGAPTNQVSFTASDRAGNVSTVTYVVNIDPPPLPQGPSDRAYVSTVTPTLVWNPNGSGASRLQLSQDEGFSSVIADSVTITGSYVSTNTLVEGSVYWWRVQGKNISSNWSSTMSFTVDMTPPAFSAPQVSTAGASAWTPVPMSVYLSSTSVNARITVQDSLAGLVVSTGASEGLVGEWHMDESSGTVALDSSGNGFTGTLVSNTTWVPGRRGGALNFASSYVNVPYQPSLTLLNDYTLEAWVRTSGAGTMTVASNYASGGGYIFGMAAGVPRYYSAGECSPANFPAFNDGKWHHYAVTMLNGYVSYYLDGALRSQKMCNLTPASGQPLRIGFRPDGYEYFAGAIDEVRLYQVAKSSGQIASDYETDTLGAYHNGAAYNVIYSTNSGVTWNLLPKTSVSLTGANGVTGAQTLTASNIPLVTSTGPFATTSQIGFTVADLAGNVSTVSYTVLVDTSVPSQAAPQSGVFLSTAAALMTWYNPWGAGTGRVQLSQNQAFTSVIADSTTANDFYFSTNSLASGSSYWWRVGNGLNSGFWTSTRSFTVDAVQPVFSAPQVSTAGASAWTALPMGVYLSSSVANLRITVQDPLSGLVVSSGPPAGLAYQWHLDESSGAAAMEASGSGLNATLINTPSWAAGLRGAALSFNGVNQYTQTQGNIGITGNAPRTLSFWFYPRAAGNMDIMTWGAGAGSQMFGLLFNTARQLYFWGYANDFTCNTPVSLNVWHHAAVTFDGATVRVYLDGVLDGWKATTLGTAATPLYVGLSRTWPYFNGKIDEVRIYNTARTPEQIVADYESDTLAAHYDDEAYTVMYSTTAGLTWNFVPTDRVAIAGSSGNGDTAARVLQADGLQLVTSTGPFAPTNQVGIAVTDMAGNVSTAVYTVLVDTSIPTPNYPPDGYFVSTTTPLLTWDNPWGAGTARLQLSQNAAFTSVVADSATANEFYISTNALAGGSSYWWRVGNGLNSGFWSVPRSFTVDAAPPALGAVAVSTDSLNWNPLLPGATLPSSVVSLRIPVQDPLAGLMVSTGLPAGLEAQWHLDESSGAVVLDASGNGITPYFVNGPIPWVQGVRGGALYFNGSNQYLNPAYQASLNLLDNFTVEVWVQVPAGDTAGRSILGNYNGASGGYILHANYGTAGNIGFWTNTVWKSCPNNPGINDGKWHHVAATQLSGVTSLYTDGRLLCSQSGSSALGSGNPLYIGIYPGAATYFKGPMDEIRIYSVARTPAQIAADYEYDTLAAHYDGEAYNVRYSTTAGLTWNYLPVENVSIAGSTGNGDTASRLLRADNIQLVVSTSPTAPTNQVSFTVSDQAGNVSTVTYVVPIGVTSLVAPAGGAYVSTAAPTLVWVATGAYRMQLATDAAYASVIADSTTANAFYISTNSLAGGSAYWWRVGGGSSGQWAVSNFTVDTVPPAFTAPQVSTAGAAAWTGLPMGVYLSSSAVNLQVTVQDPLAGLQASVQAAGLAGQWHLDESSGSAAMDSSPNGHTAVFVNGPIPWVPGRRGAALNFNGSNQYLNPGYQAELNLLDNFTVEAWVQVPAGDTAGRTILGNYNGASGGYILHANYGTAGNIGFWTNTVWKVCSANNPGINDGRWHHVAATQLSGITSLYTDGRLLCSQTGSSALGSGNPLYIGIYPGAGTYFKGPMDEVRVFNVARTAAQIAADYQSDTLSGQYGGEAYNVIYSTTAGLTWNFAPAASVTLNASGNGDTAQRVLEADGLPLVTSTGPFASTNQVGITVTDQAGNVSTAVYTVLVDTSVPTLNDPPDGVFIGTAAPLLTWYNPWGAGISRVQLSQNAAFTSVIADSVTVNAYYASTNTLAAGSSYWWRVQNGLRSSFWSAPRSFTVDVSSPVFGAPTVSTDSLNWNALLPGATLPSSVVSLRIPVRDPLAGLMVSTGLPAGLEAQWHLDESSGAVAVDSSGGSLGGNLGAGVFHVPGIRGNAVSCSGAAAGQITFAGPATTVQDNWTLSAWIKPANLAQIGIAVYNGISGSNGYGFGVGNGAGAAGAQLQGIFHGVVWVASGYTFPAANQWYHVAMLRSGGVTKFYVNGVQTPLTSASTPAVPTTMRLCSDGGTYFNGLVDEVRVYNTARTQSQILAEYESDTLAAHYNSAAYNVMYSTTAGITWNYVPAANVGVAGASGNGDTAQRVLEADNIQLVVSTSPTAPTNQVAFTVSDQAGNVSTATFVVPVGVTSLLGPADGAYVSTAAPTLVWIATGTDRLQLAADAAYASVIADSTTANTFYISTNSLASGSTYWWRVGAGTSGQWAASRFTVDTVPPVFAEPYASTSPASAAWAPLPMSVSLTSTTASVRIKVQDPLAGLMVSTGLPYGLVNQWHLDESSGPAALDASGGGFNANLVNSPAWVPGVRGAALNFNGTNQSVQTAANISITGNAPRTLSFWFYPTAAGNRDIMSWGAGAASQMYGLLFNTARQLYFWGYSNDFTCNTPVPLNTWHHAAVTFDGTTVRVYLDGALDGSKITTLGTAAGPLNIGLTRAWGYFSGRIDDVRIYSVARTQDQILAEYESDTLASHYNGAAYNVMYSTNSGVTWRFAPTSAVSLAGAAGNGDTGQRVLQADGLQLAPSTSPFSTTNQVAFTVSDRAGNVSTAAYVVSVDPPPAPLAPADGAYVSSSAPVMTWTGNGSGATRVQLSQNSAFTSVIADSVTLNSFYASTVTLAGGSSYWWRVQGNNNSGNWSPPRGFTVDTDAPVFSAPQVSTMGAPSMTDLPMSVYLPSGLVSARITVQDLLSGLMVSTGPPAGLLGQWHFDENSGNAAQDSSGSGFTGTLVNYPAHVAGRLGGALNFASSYVHVPYQAALNLLNNYTLEAWVRTSGAGTMTVASNYNGAGGGYIFGMGAGVPRFYTSGECSPTNVPAFNDGQWHHYAVTLTGGTAYYYVDGALRSQKACSNTASSGAAFRIGFRPDGAEYFAGAVDDVRVYNVARSSTQVLADYESDTLAAHYNGEPYNVLYSTNAGSSWNYVPAGSVSLTGGNGTGAPQVLSAVNIPLVTSTGTLAPTNQIEFVAADQAGNVVSAAYTVLVDTRPCGYVREFMFTDPVIIPGLTPVRAVHFTELRGDIDYLRTLAGLDPYSWTDPALDPGSAVVRAAHINDLHIALGAVYLRCGQDAPSYTDAILVPGVTPVRAVHLNEIRANVQAAP